MRSEHQQSVEWCMKAAGQMVREKPQVPSEEERILRAKLILEEALETIQALGVVVRTKGRLIDMQLVGCSDFYLSPWVAIGLSKLEPNLAEVADGCADIIVVTLGTLSSCGVDYTPVMEEVLKKNQEKFPGGVPVILPGGKYGKPPGFVPPDIAGVLRAQGWEG